MMREPTHRATPVADLVLCGAIGLVLGFMLAIGAMQPLFTLMSAGAVQ